MPPSPIKFTPEQTVQELVDVNRKVLNGIETLGRIREEDIQTVDLSPATVVTLYLYPDANLRLRGAIGVAGLETESERNLRTRLGLGVAHVVNGLHELSLQYHELAYSRPTVVGYFAPRRAQTLEAASYVELESAGGAFVALEPGIGLQRVARHGARAGPWRRALRLYALAGAPLRPWLDARLEIEAYDRRSEARHATPRESQRHVDRWGYTEPYGWSEDKARQYSVSERADFGAFIRSKKFSLK